jgi:hypothetical protein
MGQNKEQLKKLLDFIDALSNEQGNEWFVEELKKRYIPNTELGYSLRNDIEYIRDILGIKGKVSIDYSFIKHDLLREQLIIDNIRMENSALQLKNSNEVERFYNFCVNAFYQIENIINYYYFISFPAIEDLMNHLEKNNPKYERKEKHKTIADIDVAVKLYAFGNVFFPSRTGSPDSTSFQVSDLRKVRNEGLHRCSIIMSSKVEQEKNSAIYSFFKNQTFNTIRTVLKKVVLAVKQELELPQKNTLSINSGVITSLLPSGGFVTLGNGQVITMDSKLISKYKNLKVDDKVNVTIETIQGKKIINQITNCQIIE